MSYIFKLAEELQRGNSAVESENSSRLIFPVELSHRRFGYQNIYLKRVGSLALKFEVIIESFVVLEWDQSRNSASASVHLQPERNTENPKSPTYPLDVGTNCIEMWAFFPFFLKKFGFSY